MNKEIQMFLFVVSISIDVIIIMLNTVPTFCDY